MNTLRVILCALFLCLITPCPAAPTVYASLISLPFPSASAAQSMQNYAQTLVTGTPAQIAAFYAPDGQLLLPGTLPITGPKEVEAFLVPLVKQAKVTNVIVKADMLLGMSGFTTLYGTYAETFVVGVDKPQTVTGRFASVWKKDAQGERKIVRLMMQPAPTK